MIIVGNWCFIRKKMNFSISKTRMGKAKYYYYMLIGWNAETGIPISEKLEE